MKMITFAIASLSILYLSLHVVEDDLALLLTIDVYMMKHVRALVLAVGQQYNAVYPRHSLFVMLTDEHIILL